MKINLKKKYETIVDLTIKDAIEVLQLSLINDQKISIRKRFHKIGEAETMLYKTKKLLQKLQEIEDQEKKD